MLLCALQQRLLMPAVIILPSQVRPVAIVLWSRLHRVQSTASRSAEFNPQVPTSNCTPGCGWCCPGCLRSLRNPRSPSWTRPGRWSSAGHAHVSARSTLWSCKLVSRWNGGFMAWVPAWASCSFNSAVLGTCWWRFDYGSCESNGLGGCVGTYTAQAKTNARN